MLAMLGALALALSFAGWFLLARRQGQLPNGATPLVTFSLVICVLYVAGLLNLLPAAAWALLAGGLAALAVQLWRRRGALAGLLRDNFTPALLFLLAAAAVFALVLRGGSFNNVDDYTHWAAMVKEIEVFGRLPNFETRLITHQNYPPASALFIWYICHFVGLGHAQMMLAQLLLSLAGLCCLFGFAGPLRRGAGARWLPALLPAAVAILLLAGAGGTGPGTLAVDSLLAFFGLGGTLLIWQLRANVRRAAVAAAPVLTATLLLKNSGVLFVLVNVALLAVLAIRELRALPRLGHGPLGRGQAGAALALAAGGACLAPFAALLLWNSHVDLVYADAAHSRHAMRLDTLEWFLTARTRQDFADISRTFLQVGLSAENRSLLYLGLACGVILLAAALLWRADKKAAKAGLWLAAGCLALYLLYMLGLLGTYLFAMWYEDLGTLPAFARYCSTISLYLCGVAAACVLGVLGRWPAQAAMRGGLAGVWAVAGTLVLGLALMFNPHNLTATPLAQNHTLQLALDQATVVRSYGYEPNAYHYSYWVYVGHTGAGMDESLLTQMLRYTLMSQNVTVASANDDLEALRDGLNEHYFVLVAESDAEIESFLAPYSVAGTPERLYLTEALLDDR